MSWVVLSSDAGRLAQAAHANPQIRPARDLKDLSHEMLRDDTEAVVIDVEHPGIDPLEAVRLVKGTRWDVRLVCIGAGEGAQRAARGGTEVYPASAWDALARLVAGPPA